MKKIEENNTLVFIVDIKANKRQIKQSLKKLYDVDCIKINTLIRLAASMDVDRPTLMDLVDPTARRRPLPVSALMWTHWTLLRPSWRLYKLGFSSRLETRETNHGVDHARRYRARAEDQTTQIRLKRTPFYCLSVPAAVIVKGHVSIATPISHDNIVHPSR